MHAAWNKSAAPVVASNFRSFASNVGSLRCSRKILGLASDRSRAQKVAGLRELPGDAISVEPRGMPVWETAEPVPVPKGEVAPMVGVGLAIPLTCAMAPLHTISAGRTAAIKDSLIAFSF
jgi:hypothetical protein